MPFLLPPSPATETICVKIDIPNTTQDIRNFLGQLLDLAQWFNYERTGTDLGKQVADTWRDTLSNVLIGACMIVRQDPIRPCIFQSSTDGGETWTDWGDITDCVNSAYIQQLIDDNISLQQTIAGYSIGSPTDGNSTELQSALDADLMDSPVGCDNDHIYGMALQLVTWLDAISEDILEFFVSAPTTMSRLGDIIEAIPGVGELPLDDAFQFVESVLDDWNQAYQAAFTQQMKTDLACGLLCIAQGTCSLTLEQVRDFYKDQLTSYATFDNQLQFFEALIAYNWIGNATVYGFHMMILQSMIFGGEVLGFDVNKLVRMVQAMYNDPDPDWSTVCTTCSFNATVVSNGVYTELDTVPYLYNIPDPSYCEGAMANNLIYGCEPDLTPNNINAIALEINVPVGTTINEIHVDMTWSSDRSPGGLYAGLNEPAGLIQQSGSMSGSYTSSYTLLNLTNEVATFKCFTRTNGSALMHIDEIRIVGTGINPYV